MNYEQSLEELEKISAKLEDEKTGLDEAISLFEKSIEVSKNCFDKLKEADGKVTILKKQLDKLKEENFVED